MIALSKRLSLIASLVPGGSRVCDVGTDHGYVAAALIKSGNVKSVTATDIKKKPLENAKDNLLKLGINNVKLILCDGLSGVERKDADCVIIAGMGGQVISKIISDCDFLPDKSVTMILQPMTGASELRVFLAENGYNVFDEIAVCENKKVYSVMVVKYDGVFRSLSFTEQKIGKLKADSHDSNVYLEKQLRICRSCADSLCQIPEKKEEAKQYRIATENIIDLLEKNHGI